MTGASPNALLPIDASSGDTGPDSLERVNALVFAFSIFTANRVRSSAPLL